METISEQNITIKLAPMFAVLANPVRLHVLLHLAKVKSCTACKISQRLPLAKSTLSVHMSKLKKAGLIISHPEGSCQKYQLSEEGLINVKAVFGQFISEILSK